MAGPSDLLDSVNRCSLGVGLNRQRGGLLQIGGVDQKIVACVLRASKIEISVGVGFEGCGGDTPLQKATVDVEIVAGVQLARQIRIARVRVLDQDGILVDGLAIKSVVERAAIEATS